MWEQILFLRRFNSFWTGLQFPTQRDWGWGGGGGVALPPYLAISSQMVMKLGMNILWVGRKFFKLVKNFDDVIVISVF